MFKKVLSLFIAVLMVAALCVSMSSCGNTADDDFKLGVILLHDEASTYDLNFIEAVNRAAEQLGLSEDQVLFKKNIPESNDCYEAAADLVDDGCDVIFADSFGHETFLLKAAKEFTDVQFCHATGTMAHTEKLDNFHNAFASIYEGRFLAGVAAGMKLNEMIESGKITADAARIGYVGAFPFEEVKSGYTAFFLGARSVCPSVTMDVKFTNSWGDLALEKEAAEALIASGCVLISQHADTTGAPTACEAAGVPCVGYNISMIPAAPNSALISAACNWGAYFEFALKNVLAGEAFAPDWCYGYVDGAVFCTELNETTAPAGAAEKVAEVEAALKDGSLKVFDVTTFTVKPSEGGTYTVDENGHVTSAFALDTDGDFAPDFGEAIVDGAFAESTLRSAPYFGLDIDGITMVE